MDAPHSPESETVARLAERLARLERRADRERRARLEAERLLEDKARALYTANQRLCALTGELEARVAARMRELNDVRERALELAERDQLTGLSNRASFARLLDDAIARSDAGFALLLIDLDRFKEINDTLGHAVGDLLLQHVARGLRAACGDAPVARLGGDEFAMILDRRALTLDGAAQAILAAVRAPVSWQGRPIETSASIGIALYPDDAAEAGALQRFADIALYRAKATRAAHVLYDARIGRELEERRALGAELSRAIAAGEIEAWFQPVVDGLSCGTVGVEALARWNHPERGIVPPAQFVPLAEERGLMSALFAKMLRSACPPARRWIQQGKIRSLSVNVSPSQFRLGSLPQDIAALLHELDFPAEALTIEITEEVLMSDLDRARGQLEQIAAQGIEIALDDFGIGYSNIGYLRQLPFRTLKLDRSLIADLTREDKVRRILGALVELARALDLQLVAEGVEEAEQALWLGRLGCRRLQGYLFGRPMSARDFEHWTGAAGHGADTQDPAPVTRLHRTAPAVARASKAM